MATLKPKPKSPPPDHTFEEAKYLRYLVEQEIPVEVKLSSNEVVTGTIEFFDHAFIRLTREKGANLFIFKHDIKYLYERP